MKYTTILAVALISLSYLEAGYNEGKEIFDAKCSSCHVPYISAKEVQENFFEKNNTMLNLKAPTVNMLAYAIMDGAMHVGDKSDPEMQQMEIEEFLKDYLEAPNLSNSICDKNVIKYYKVKDSMKGQLKKGDYENLATFFMDYKKERKKEKSHLKNKSTQKETAVSTKNKKD